MKQINRIDWEKKNVAKETWIKFGDQLGGTILHPQYFVKRIEQTAVAKLKKLSKGKTVLDIGCGRQWYRPQLEVKTKKYIALDHPEVSQKYKSKIPIEILADAEKIPLASNSIDLAFMIMVLEHLPNPDLALKETYRILKPEGLVLICTVENYPGHDFPYNYYHWTYYGLREILGRNKLKLTEHRNFGTVWQTITVYQNVYFMNLIKELSTRKNLYIGLLLLIILSPVMILGNIFAYVLSGNENLEFSLGHIVIAKKVKA